MSTATQTIPAETPTDLNRPITVSVESSPKDQQLPFCDMCGNNLSFGAKFCDSCGNAVTQQTKAASVGMQITPANIQQSIIPRLDSAVAVTERSQTGRVSCEGCGRELQNGDKFCDKCGAPIQLNYA
jgi:predicted amidophosphoribosyltransferase